jgi:hypothetical protein
MAVLGNPTDGATAPVDLAAFDAAQGREEVMEHGDLVGRLRDLGIRSADLAADALEAAQARIAALEAELAGAQKERDGVRKALDYLLSDPAVPPSALERTRVLMQHYKAAQP